MDEYKLANVAFIMDQVIMEQSRETSIMFWQRYLGVNSTTSYHDILSKTGGERIKLLVFVKSLQINCWSQEYIKL